MRVQTVFGTGLSLVLILSAGCHSSQHAAAPSAQANAAPAQAAPTAPSPATMAEMPPLPPPAASKPAPAAPPAAKPTEPLFAGLGDHHRKVTTSSKDAQKYFDQGLIFAFSFNHDEAIKSFQQAAEFDPNCAMAYWGVSLCNGPHINNPAMDEAHIKAAWEALQQAKAQRDSASDVEKALIDALGARYSADPKADRAILDKSYADAMAGVSQRYPDDVDVVTLYAESLMDLRPWDLWEHDGQPRPETPHVIAALEHVMLLDPEHPGANHLYIHAVEASPQPARGITAANRLRTLVPAAGHMVHMPAHIDIRVGQWQMAAKQNQDAIAADDAYRKISPNQGFYHIYMAHNHQFLSFADMMRGRREESVAAMRDMIAGVPQVFITNMGPAIDGYLCIQYECPMRFGLWDDVLKEPAPPANLPIMNAFWHYARATSMAAKGDVDAAIAEQSVFHKAVEAVPADAKMAINKAHTVLALADHVLTGEIAYRRGEIDKAVSELTEAVKIEDGLMYMEPPDWLIPTRHALGAVLVDAGRMNEAEAVYRADLKYWPENGWSLYGLWQCLNAKHDPQAELVKRRFDKVWEGSDTPLSSTCMCVSKK